jgi:hypothetical protein
MIRAFMPESILETGGMAGHLVDNTRPVFIFFFVILMCIPSCGGEIVSL